jgi:predicted  nucleic acid-binding Zn-ribbon protein
MSELKILEYQTIDMNIYKKERDFVQSVENRTVFKYKDDIKKQTDAMTELTKDLENCFIPFPSLREKCVNAEKAYNDLNTVDFDSFASLEDFDNYEKDLKKCEDALNELKKDITKAVGRISDIAIENKRLNDLIDKLIMEFNRAKNIAEAKKNEVLREVIPFARQLKALESEIPEKQLIKYRQLRSQKKMPAYVPYVDGNCFGCGMNIKIEVDKYMKDVFDCAECPHCGRIVYKTK